MNKLFFLLIFLLLSTLKHHCQEQKFKPKIDSNSFHSVSLGWSNPISHISSLFSSTKTDSIFGVLLDYQLNLDIRNFYRLHSKFSPSFSNNKFEMENLLISLSKGKVLVPKKKLVISNGIGPYFKCNFYRVKQGQGIPAIWSSDYYGFGMEYFMMMDYLLSQNFYLNILINLNLGFHQDYDISISNNNKSQEVWSLQSENRQLISFSLKKLL